MVRIIPWNLPPVNGGSVGGYTPAPTPPVPTNYPYDLDNMSLITDFVVAQKYKSSSNYLYFTTMKGQLTISGVTILDSTSVSSVIATVQVTAGTDTWSDASSQGTLLDAEIQVDISSYMTAEGGTVDLTNINGYAGRCLQDMSASSYNTPYPTLVSTTSTLTVTSIKVYNSNGIVIQEWSP